MSIAEVPVGSALAETVVVVLLEHSLGAAACGITVKLDGTRVILYGIVDSCVARTRAETAVRNIPGITEVTNYLYVAAPTPEEESTQPDAATVGEVGVLTR